MAIVTDSGSAFESFWSGGSAEFQLNEERRKRHELVVFAQEGEGKVQEALGDLACERALRLKAEASVTRLSVDLADCEHDLAESLHQNDALQDDVCKKSDYIKGIERDLQNARESEVELRALQLSVHSRSCCIRDLQIELEKSREEVKTLAGVLNALQSEHVTQSERCKSELSIQESRLQSTRALAAHLGSELAEREHLLQSCNARLKESQAESESKDRRAQKLMIQLKGVQARESAAREALAAAQPRLETAQAALESNIATEMRTSELCRQLQKYQNKCGDLQGLYEHEEKACLTEASTSKELQKRVGDFEKDLAECRWQTQALEAEYALCSSELNAERGARSQALCDLDRCNSELNCEQAARKYALERERTARRQSFCDLERTTTYLSSVRRELETSKAEVQCLEHERERRCRAAKSESETLCSQNEATQLQLSSALNQTHRLLRERESEIDSLRDELLRETSAAAQPWCTLRECQVEVNCLRKELAMEKAAARIQQSAQAARSAFPTSLQCSSTARPNHDQSVATLSWALPARSPNRAGTGIRLKIEEEAAARLALGEFDETAETGREQKLWIGCSVLCK